MMKLYFSGASPFVRKVLVVLHETGQMDEVALETIQTTAITPDAGVAASNPLKKIPALVRADGVTLYDSRVITAWLDDRAGAGLYPQGAGRFDMAVLEATADGIMDAAVSMAYETRLRPADKQWDGWLDAQWGKVTSACAALENRWMGHLQGELNIGQIAVACALGYLDFRHDARGWRDGVPGLAAWYAAFSERPSMVASAPPEAV